MKIKKLEPKQPKSASAMVELLRGYLDKSFDAKITYLEITCKCEGDINTTSISISAPD